MLNLWQRVISARQNVMILEVLENVQMNVTIIMAAFTSHGLTMIILKNKDDVGPNHPTSAIAIFSPKIIVVTLGPNANKRELTQHWSRSNPGALSPVHFPRQFGTKSTINLCTKMCTNRYMYEINNQKKNSIPRSMATNKFIIIVHIRVALDRLCLRQGNQ